MIKELIILDLDNVIINGQSQKILLNYLFGKRIIGFFYYFHIYFWFILYKLGLAKNPKEIMEYAFSFLKGRKVNEAEEIIDDFFERVLKNFIFQEMVDIINSHRKEKRELIIISNVIEILAKKIAEFLDINNYIATKLEVMDGKFTGRIVGDIVYGENKVNCIKKFIKENNLNLIKSWAYADHISDLGILNIVNNPLVVNPNRKMREEARKRKWPILNFDDKT